MRKLLGIDVDKFWRVWIRVLEHMNTGGYTIVEGYNDRKALSELMINKRVLILQTFGIENIVDSLNEKSETLILLDFDTEGEKLAFKLEHRLRQEGINVKHELREEIRKIISPIKQIENLSHVSNYLMEYAPFDIYLKMRNREIGNLVV